MGRVFLIRTETSFAYAKMCARDVVSSFGLALLNNSGPTDGFKKIECVSINLRTCLSTVTNGLKALGNEKTILPKHCCGSTCFPVCGRRTNRTNICCRRKNVSYFVQKHFSSLTNASSFARRNNVVSTFVGAFRYTLRVGGPTLTHREKSCHCVTLRLHARYGPFSGKHWNIILNQFV